MGCEIIRDLMPLYLDDCCSEGSRRLLEDHIKECDSCRKLLGEMSKELVVGAEERCRNLSEEKLLKTGKEMIRTEVRGNYLEKIVWMDIPLNVMLSIFGIIIVIKYSSDILEMVWDNNVPLGIYTCIGDPAMIGLSLYFFMGEILYLAGMKKKRRTEIFNSIILESVFYKIALFAVFAVSGLMLML